ncbi:MAG: TIGR03915 family putative DNA repair protein [Firmicutes bacterium]|nr:TIGR03915 family putative DNA repair protein [Bacillota bacterium]
MPGGKPLAEPCDLVYLYDGGLEGLYTCVHESVYLRQLPLDIWPQEEAQPTLLAKRAVQTDQEKARKVRGAMEKKLTLRTRELVETVFLSCLEHKEIKILRFLLRSFQEGPRTLDRPDHPEVAPLLKAERQLLNEAHLFTGFVRFADIDGKLAATIRPKNFVLPFLAEHFMERYPGEDFMIYDKTHGAALLYQRGRGEIVRVASFEAGEVSETETRYQALWKALYETVAIEARYNPKCRMTHMPKRYWPEMTETKRYL